MNTSSRTCMMRPLRDREGDTLPLLRRIKGGCTGMRKSVSLLASMALAVLVACVAAALTAVPGSGQTRTVTLVGAGDIASCSQSNDSATARLLRDIPGTVFTLGDNVYPYGSAENFRNCYDPTWGRYKKRTKPALGNHEYYDENFNMTTAAGPYFDYFGARAAGRGKGYSSHHRRRWPTAARRTHRESRRR